MNEEMQQTQLLEAFVSDSDLGALEDQLGDFNLFEVLGVQKREPQHSNLLGWLLDPLENHGLGDAFIKRFFFSTTGLARERGVPALRPIDVHLADFGGSATHREWRNIDILVVNEAMKLVVAIENKIMSGEHGRQLTRYRKEINQAYPGYRHHFVFLTPGGDDPESEVEQSHWVPASYGTVIQTIEAALASRAGSIASPVETLVRHYITMLRRHVVEDSDVQELARRIYARHRAAIELIRTFADDPMTDVRSLLEQIVTDDARVNLAESQKTIVRFLPPEWSDVPLLNQGSGWVASGRMTLFELKCFDFPVILTLALGPGPEDLRRDIFEYAQDNPDIFKGARRTLTRKWSQLYRKELINKELAGADIESLAEVAQSNFQAFMNADYDPIVNTVVSFSQAQLS